MDAWPALPTEIVANILGYLGSVPDLQNARLVCRRFAVMVEASLGDLLFKTYCLNVGDTKQLEKMSKLVHTSLFREHLEFLTVSFSAAPGARFDKSRTGYSGTSSSLQLNSQYHYYMDDFSRSVRRCSYHGISAASLMAIFSKNAVQIQRIVEAMCNTDKALAELAIQGWEANCLSIHCAKPDDAEVSTLYTKALLQMWQLSGVKILSLELGRTLLCLEDASELHKLVMMSPNLSRLSFRLSHRIPDIGAAATEVRKDRAIAWANSLADSLSSNLNELVISTQDTILENDPRAHFIDTLLTRLTLPKLDYLYLEGLGLRYYHLLKFLSRHQATLSQHCYDNCYFLDVTDHSDLDVETMMNEDLARLDLPKVVALSISLSCI